MNSNTVFVLTKLADFASWYVVMSIIPVQLGFALAGLFLRNQEITWQSAQVLFKIHFSASNLQ